MFSFLIFNVRSEFWRFSAKRYKQIEKNSFDKPLFVVAYSPWCGHCTEIPNESRIFRESTLNRNDFYFTLLNCGEGDACTHFYVPHTPYIVLVQGDERDYWPETKQHTAAEWLKFIDENIRDHLIKIDDESLIESYKSNLTGGGSLFYLQLQSEHSPIFKAYQEIAKRYYIYHDTFLYRIAPSKPEKIVAYTSPSCQIEYSQTSLIKTFIDHYKFGASHRYLEKEINSLHQSQLPSAVLLVEDNYQEPKITEGLKKDVLKIADQNCNLKTGWMSFRYNEGYLQDHKINDEDMPTLIYNGYGCLNRYQGRIRDVIDTDFLNLSISKQMCNKLYYNTDGSQTIKDSDDRTKETKNLWWRNTISGWQFIVFYLSALFAVLGFLAIVTPNRSKSKDV